MALVDYSSSDEENLSKSSNQATHHKRKRDNDQENSSTSSLPPLPSKFHDLYASNVRSSTQDDPTLHGGRKRITPHIEGNWPTHVYIEWYPSSTEHDILTNIISDLKKTVDNTTNIHSFLSSDLGATLPLHISLSRPIGFSTDKKDSFAVALSDTLRSSGVRPFEITIGELSWESNFEKTRWFLVLRIKTPPNNELNKLLHVVNEVVEDYGQPPLYAAPRGPRAPRFSNLSKTRRRQSKTERALDDTLTDWSHAFHFSIAWTLNEPNEDLRNATVAVNTSYKYGLTNICVALKEVKNKVGNVVHNLDLATKEVEGGSLFGL